MRYSMPLPFLRLRSNSLVRNETTIQLHATVGITRTIAFDGGALVRVSFRRDDGILKQFARERAAELRWRKRYPTHDRHEILDNILDARLGLVQLALKLVYRSAPHPRYEGESMSLRGKESLSDDDGNSA